MYVQKKIERWNILGIAIVIGILMLGLCYISQGCVTSEKGIQFREDTNPEDYGLILDRVEIEIEGLEEEYTFLYMTDNQADFDSREELGWFGSAETRCFRDENGVSAADNFENWIRYANDSRVDGVLMGGDVIDFLSEENITAVQAHLSELTMPYLYTYGNHDSYIPWENRFDDENADFLKVFKDNNCEFQVMDEDKFYIVSIRNYQKDGKAQISEEALEKYKEVASEGKPIILVCHVPIYTSYANDLKENIESIYGNTFLQYDAGEFGMVNKSVLLGEQCGYELTTETQEFLNEVISEDSPVVAILAGHLHTSWQGYINENVYEYVGKGAFENKGALIHVSGKLTHAGKENYEQSSNIR